MSSSGGERTAQRPSPFRPRLGRLYFALQAAAGALWWIGVFTLAPVRSATLGDVDPVIVAVLDVPLFVLASGLAAAGVRAAVWVVVPWTALVTGGMALYATVTGAAGWGVVLMGAATIGSGMAGMLVLLGRVPTERVIVGPFVFRTARAGGASVQLGRTGAQIAVFWGLFLLVFPVAIAALEQRWGLSIPVPAAVTVAGAALVLAASALGIWSAVAMSVHGEGTPLPSAMARRLVIAGPYRHVRNPMAVSGIAQGMAVGLILGSWLVVVYALVGSLFWNAVIRPLEEADLEERFGAVYAGYRDEVPCWRPRLRAHGAPRPASTRDPSAASG